MLDLGEKRVISESPSSPDMNVVVIENGMNA